MPNLDGTRFRVTQTAAAGVVSSNTVLELQQRGVRVVGRYRGGSIARGCLVGMVSDAGVQFRYVQREESGQLHAGHSSCTIKVSTDGRRLLREHFTWETRAGSGINVFEEITAAS